MFIEDEQIKEAAAMLKNHLTANQIDMDEAFSNSDDDGGYVLDVACKIQFKAQGQGVLVKTSMGFSTGKVKESDERMTYPKQQKLGDMG